MGKSSSRQYRPIGGEPIFETPAEARDRGAAVLGSQQLLVRLLRAGQRRRPVAGLEGLSHARFVALCAENGL